MHEELVQRAEKWLRKYCGCGVVFNDNFQGLTKERPDAIGWRSGDTSILIECKASRADFLADQKKKFRIDPHLGMGGHRYYLCPPDIILPEDLPDGWRLLWCYPKKICQIVGPKGNCHWGRPPFENRNRAAEINTMYSALRRMEIRGHLKEIYDGLPQRSDDDLPKPTQKLIEDRMTSADLLIDELSEGGDDVGS